MCLMNLSPSGMRGNSSRMQISYGLQKKPLICTGAMMRLMRL